MSYMKENRLLMFYAIIMMMIVIVELFLDFNWKSMVAQIVFYLVLYIIATFVCISASKFDKRIEVLIFIILISTAIMNKNFWIFISGIAVTVFSLKQVNYTSKIIVIASTAIIIASAVLFGMVDSELVTERVVREDNSPNDKYVVEQVCVDANVAGTAIKVNLRKEFFGIIDISYRIRLNKDKAEVIWIDERTFTVDGELMEVGF